MKLFFSPLSPYVRKVNVVLHELGKVDAVEFAEIATTAFQSDTGLIASNPLGKIPALERPDGPTLYDSRVICRFLNDAHGGSLYPQSGRQWETLTLEATGDGIMDCAVSMAYEVWLRPEAEQSKQWIEAQWSKIARALGVLNARWVSHLEGPLDIGQIAVGCALGYLDLRHDARGWRDGNDALAGWFEKFDSRDAMRATAPPAAT